jgi:ubiquitin-conjugating enzyme E2 variant
MLTNNYIYPWKQQVSIPSLSFYTALQLGLATSSKQILLGYRDERGLFAATHCSAVNQILVPRTFRLYEELERAEHAQLSDQSVSYGLDKGDDQSFTQWNGTIVGPPSTNFDNRIFFLNIECGPNYPMTAPVVRFTSKINLPSVNQTNGLIETSKFHLFRNWQKETTMEKILIALKQEMIANKSSKQPADGDFF